MPPMISAPTCRPALPPVMCSAWTTTSSRMKPKASVAIDKYMPRTRSAGRPIMMPVIPATSADMGSEIMKGQPLACK